MILLSFSFSTYDVVVHVLSDNQTLYDVLATTDIKGQEHN